MEICGHAARRARALRSRSDCRGTLRADSAQPNAVTSALWLQERLIVRNASQRLEEEVPVRSAWTHSLRERILEQLDRSRRVAELRHDARAPIREFGPVVLRGAPRDLVRRS